MRNYHEYPLLSQQKREEALSPYPSTKKRLFIGQDNRLRKSLAHIEKGAGQYLMKAAGCSAPK
jgi:hypothetical protein